MKSILRQSLTLILFIAISASLKAQIGIGTNAPDTSVILEIKSTKKGVLIPRVDDAQTADKVKGSLLLDKATGKFKYYDGTQWLSVNPLNPDVNDNVTVPKNLTVTQNATIGGNTTLDGTIQVNGNSVSFPNATSVNAPNAAVSVKSIAGNGVGVTNVNADLLDGQHGNYYATVSGLTNLSTDMTQNYNDLDNKINTKLDVKAFTDGWKSLSVTCMANCDYFTVSNQLYYKEVGSVVLVLGNLNISVKKDHLTYIELGASLPQPLSDIFIPLNILSDNSGGDYQSLWARITTWGNFVVQCKSNVLGAGKNYFMPVNFFYMK